MSDSTNISQERPSTNNIINNVVSQLSATTFILLFMYVCGGLYLIFYWNSLNIYIFPIVTITEIPKSFIYPFLLSNGYIAFRVLLLCLRDVKHNMPALRGNFLISFSNLFKKVDNRRRPVPYPGFNLEHPEDPILFWCALVVVSIIIFALDRGDWHIVSFLVIFPISEMVIRMPFVKRGIKHYLLRRFLIVCIIATPILSIVMGILESFRVRNNWNITYVELTFQDSSSTLIPEVPGHLKLLGFAGDKIIVSTLNNERKYLINQTSVHRISLSKTCVVSNNAEAK